MGMSSGQPNTNVRTEVGGPEASSFFLSVSPLSEAKGLRDSPEQAMRFFASLRMTAENTNYIAGFRTIIGVSAGNFPALNSTSLASSLLTFFLPFRKSSTPTMGKETLSVL